MNNPNSFIDSVARHLTASHDLSKESVTVVFPNKRAAYSLRQKLRDIVDETIWLPKTMSIEEVVTQWSGLELAGKLDVIFEIVAVDNEMHPDKMSDLSKFGGMAAQMADDFDELDNYQINAKDLFGYITDMKKIGLWDITSLTPKEKESQYIGFYQSLFDYYTKLRERLIGQKKGYYGMITRMLAETSDDVLLPKIKGDKIIFAGFNALTRCEENIIDRLVKSGVAETLWDFDRYYVDDTQNEAGDFARELMEKHHEWFENGISLGNNLLEKKRTITVIDTAGNSLQAKALQEQLSLNAKNGAKNEAVVLVNEDLLIPVLNSIPKNISDTSIKISMGYPIRMTPVEGLTSLYFRLHRRRFNRGHLYIWTLIEITDLDIVKLIFSDDEQNAITKWKNDRLKNNSFSINNGDIGIGKDSDIEKLMLLMTNEANTPAALVGNLKEIVILMGRKAEISGNPNAQFVKTQISEAYKITSRIDDMLTRHAGIIANNETIESLYKTVSRETNVKISSEGTDGLQVMGLLETRNLDFDSLHLLSANEGSLPKNVNSGSFIPYFIRCTMGMPDNRRKQSVFAYHFYRLLQNCENAFVYYNSDKDAEGDKSRFLMQIERELVPKSGGNTVINTIHFVTSNAPKDTIVSKISIAKNNDVYEKLTKKLEAGVAPTTLQKYIICPLQFCLRYIYGIENNEVDENMQNNEIGNAVHNTLDEAFKAHIGKHIGNQTLDAIRQKAKEILSGLELPQNSYNLLNKVVIEQFVNNYLKAEKGGFTLLATEEEFKTDLNVNGQICKIKGTIDRIDRLDDGTTRIADYKTSKKIEAIQAKPKNSKDSDAIEAFEEIEEKPRQLLIYKYLYLKKHPEIAPEKVSASIIGLLGHSSQLYHDLEVKDGELDEHFMERMEDLLSTFVSRILDKDTDFTQTDNERNCAYCDFKAICGREKESRY